MDSREILKKLKSRASAKNAAGMARFGVRPKTKVYGVPVPFLRQLAGKIGKDHRLAADLWSSKIHEAKILASMIEDINLVSGKQMDNWVKGFDSWDVCDQTCMNLFCRHPLAFQKCFEWVKKEPEFVRRAGFALMACLAVKNKQAGNKDFLRFLPVIKKYSFDGRNYVRKAVNWALRQIGKRNSALNAAAIKMAKEIYNINNKIARWIASDARRELESAAVQKRLQEKTIN